jgi:hypothetical protein
MIWREWQHGEVRRAALSAKQTTVTHKAVKQMNVLHKKIRPAGQASESVQGDFVVW